MSETNGISGSRELAIATEPVELRHLNGGVQAVFRFPNGFGASVVRGPYTHGGRDGMWELGVVEWSGEKFELTYDTDIADDVVGYLSSGEVDVLLAPINGLDANGRERQEAAAADREVAS